MKTMRSLGNSTQRNVLATILLAGFLGTGVSLQAKSDPFSGAVCFGDSLTDTGNLYDLTGGYPGAPYYQGHFCNGPVWVEYLASDLGMDYRQEQNFAVGGATTGTINYNDTPEYKFPGLQNQVDAYIAAGGVAEPGRALFIVGAGANDVFVAMQTGMTPQTMIANGVNNTVVAIQKLYGAGARNIMIMNLPDLGVTPMGLASGGSASITYLCAAYNQVLGLALDNLADAGIATIRLNAFAVLDSMATEPDKYGFSDVTTPLSYLPPSVDPSGFLFWDLVHPTTGAHRVLATEAMQQLMNRFSPSQGKGKPEPKHNSLRGLVNADLSKN